MISRQFIWYFKTPITILSLHNINQASTYGMLFLWYTIICDTKLGFYQTQEGANKSRDVLGDMNAMFQDGDILKWKMLNGCINQKSFSGILSLHFSNHETCAPGTLNENDLLIWLIFKTFFQFNFFISNNFKVFVTMCTICNAILTMVSTLLRSSKSNSNFEW